MIARWICTVVLLLMAFYAFWGNALDTGTYFNPIGILFLLFASATWFKWEIIRDAFGAAKDESDIPILRMGYKVFQGIGAKTARNEVPAEQSPSGR